MQNGQKHEKPLKQSWWCEFHQLWKGTNMKGKGLLSNVKFKNELGQKMPYKWVTLMHANGGMDNYEIPQRGIMTKE